MSHTMSQSFPLTPESNAGDQEVFSVADEALHCMCRSIYRIRTATSVKAFLGPSRRRSIALCRICGLIGLLASTASGDPFSVLGGRSKSIAC